MTMLSYIECVDERVSSTLTMSISGYMALERKQCPLTWLHVRLSFTEVVDLLTHYRMKHAMSDIHCVFDFVMADKVNNFGKN